MTPFPPGIEIPGGNVKTLCRVLIGLNAQQLDLCKTLKSATKVYSKVKWSLFLKIFLISLPAEMC